MLAETPEGDVIADILRGVRLTASVFMDGRFTAPFAVISPARWDANSAMSRLRHISVFHLVAEGSGLMTMPDGTSTEIATGDMLLLPFTPEHRFSRGEHDGFVYGPDLLEAGPIPGVAVVRHPGEGDETRLVCGFMESAELMATPFFRSLPPLIVERAGTVTGPVAAMAANILAQIDGGPSPAIEIMLGRLMELLFVELLRRHAARLPAQAKGVLAASRDPVVARALTAMHRDPVQKWTVESLARAAGASRTVLAERFGRLLDMPPIEYLTGWRMQLACDKLCASSDALGEVAAGVGYDSEAAFSRAFRRVVGCSPGRWRLAA
jgi:AraC-like DNA-binding protein